MEFLENRIYEELQVGDNALFSRTLTQEDIWLYAYVSHDFNPVHLDETYAQSTLFKGTVGHGMFYAAMLSSAVANQLPGPGTIFLSQEFKLRNPARIGDHLSGEITVVEKKRLRHIVIIDCIIKNQEGKTVFSGISTVIAPTEKLKLVKPTLPKVSVQYDPTH